jgi:hypothetical protein
MKLFIMDFISLRSKYPQQAVLKYPLVPQCQRQFHIYAKPQAYLYFLISLLRPIMHIYLLQTPFGVIAIQ